MTEKVVIMIHGKSEHGKGTVAEILERRLKDIKEFNVIRCSLSTWIRETMKKDFYWDGIDTPESRKCMAEIYRVGTEFYPYHMARRVWERDIKLKVIHAISIRKGGCTVGLQEIEKNIIIVESLREKVNYDFFEMLLKEGSIDDLITVSVERPGYESTQKLTNHVSEVDLDDFIFDYLIVNDGSLEDLENKTVRYIISDILDVEERHLNAIK